MKLRDYQEEAVRKILDGFKEKTTLLAVLATGLGKTVIFSEIARRFLDSGRVVVVVHREELLWQAKEHLERLGLEVGIERRNDRDLSGLYTSRISVATIQSLARKERLSRVNPDLFSLVIIDEAHHATASTYKRVMGHFVAGGAKVLGVTATPLRTDGRGLSTVFESVAFSYGLLDGIRDGWLVPVKQYFATDVQVDFGAVHITRGDYDEEELEQVLGDEKNLHAVAHIAIEASKKGPVLVYTPGVRTAMDATYIINRYKPGSAAYVIGNMDNAIRRGVMENFRSGELPILVNCMVATEGFDAPLTRTIVMARPTRSSLLYTQILGRGTRPAPGVVDSCNSKEERVAAIKDSVKPCLYICDLISENEETRPITSIDVLAPSTLMSLVPKKVEQICKSKAAADQESAIEASDVYEAIKKDLAISIEAREARREMGRLDIMANVSYKLKKTNPFASAGWSIEIDTADMLATESQKSLLKRLGVEKPPDNLTRSAASEMINILIDRKKRGLASYKQVKLLVSHNVPPLVAHEMTVSEASYFISILRSRGFKGFGTTSPPTTIKELEEWRGSRSNLKQASGCGSNR
ncbi:MAG: DEAD/DEAH box helicase [Candidatus Methanomethylicaceae archaeon]